MKGATILSNYLRPSVYFASIFFASFLTMGTTARTAAAISSATPRSPQSQTEENTCSKTDNTLEQKINSWFAPREKNPNDANKFFNSNNSHFNTAPPLARFNPYRYNFYRFGWFYPFARSGIFPQQYVAGGTLVSIPSLNDFISSVFRLQVHGASDYLTSREFSPLIQPQAELTLALSYPETKKNILLYYLRDASAISPRAKALGASNFYSKTPGLLLRFHIEALLTYHAQAVMSYGGWFLGGRHIVEEDAVGRIFLFGKENLYAGIAQFPEMKSTSLAIFWQEGFLHYSLQGEKTSEGWQASVNILGSMTEAELLGK